jgi:Ca2+-binding RTX toxin-like protein
MALVKVGAGTWLDMTWLNIGNLAYGEMTFANAGRMTQEFDDGTVTEFFGSFSYTNQGVLAGGTLTGMEEYVDGQFEFELSGFSVPVGKFIGWIETGDTYAAESYMFSGADQMIGNEGNDALLGFAGNDSINGGGGDDALAGNEGDDTLYGGYGDDYIVGLEGADVIEAGWGSDDINGNQGTDTVRGGDDADWVRGGKDNDVIYGDAGDDPHLNGNLGDDYVFGGTGKDTVYGGQGADVLYGQEGADLLSGDMGSDTLVGGDGADRFLFGRNGGADLVTDFSTVQGDKLLLATGTTYNTSVADGNTIVGLGDGDTITLQGVTLSGSDWIAFV